VTPVSSGLLDGLLSIPGSCTGLLGGLLSISLSALTAIVGAVISVAACLLSGLLVTVHQILTLATGHITCPGGSGLGGLVIQLGCTVNGILLGLVDGVLLLANSFSLCILDANTGLVSKVFQIVGGILQSNPVSPPACIPASTNPCLTGVDSGVSLSLTADNEIKALYINGVQVPNSCLPNAADWTKVDTVPLPTMTKTIAVQLVDWRAAFGFLASSSDLQILSNGLWKCTNSANPGSNWMTNEFDDSLWSGAYVIAMNGMTDHGFVNGISALANWIWTTPHADRSGDPNIYCRYKLNWFG